MPNYIYELVDPRTNIVRYVGITNLGVELRLKMHIQSSKDIMACNDEKKAWIQELLIAGYEPLVNIIEVIKDREEALLREKYWIRTYLDQGVPLTNIQSTRIPSAEEEKPKGPSPLRQEISAYFYTAAEAIDKLGINRNKFNYLVKTGRIHKLVLLGSHGLYRKADINKLAKTISQSK